MRGWLFPLLFSSPLFSGSTCKMGEAEGIVISTGANTFFGRAATLVGEDNDSTGHLQAVLARIGLFCMVSIGSYQLPPSRYISLFELDADFDLFLSTLQEYSFSSRSSSSTPTSDTPTVMDSTTSSFS